MPNQKPPIRIGSCPGDCILSDTLMNLDPNIIILRTSAIEKRLKIETDISLQNAKNDNMLETIVDDATNEFASV